MSFFAELKRRNVLRAGALYIGAAWALSQGVAQLLPVFDFPNWVIRWFVIAAMIGFPFAMAFSWFYEWTPQGIVRESEVPPEASITRETGRKMDRWIIAVMAVAIVLLLTNTFVWHKGAGLENSDAIPAGDKSIAVLPFVNMSGEKDNEYFSDGISEEILNVLGRTPDLQVAARTSSFAFKGKPMEVPAIARELKVRMVLEGSVRRQGDRVRVTAQLIDARTGFNVWSQNYDRRLQDIFAIQDEIAKSIGDALEVKLADSPKVAGNSVGTSNLKAYDLYLRGLALWQLRRDDTLWQAIGLFEQATAADPKFAQGYAGEALVFAIISDYTRRITDAESLVRATDAAERALALDAWLPEPYAVLGMVATREYRRGTADALFARAIALRPSFATAWQWRGSELRLGGDLAGGLAAAERASALDPRSLIIAENHAYALRALGRNAEAIQVCQRALDIAPAYGGCLDDIAMADLQLRDYDAAKAMFARLAATANTSAASQGQDIVAALAGSGDRHALALRYAAFAIDSQNDPDSGNALESYDVAAVLMMLGERELALDYLERIASDRSGLADWAVMLPAMDPIRCDPRFAAVVKKLDTTDPHAAKVCGGRS